MIKELIDINNLSLFIKGLNTNRRLTIHRKSISGLVLDCVEGFNDSLCKRNDYGIKKCLVKKERFPNNNRFN